MGTGACGIHCDTCRLKVRGLCSTCGAGTGNAGSRKLEAQYRVFNGYCPILKCAHDHRIAYCMRDCKRFPCKTFEQGPYPFSEGFLTMQNRRRSERRPPSPHLEDMAQWEGEEVDAAYWEELLGKDPQEVCRAASVAYDPDRECYRVPFLDRSYLVDPVRRSAVPEEQADASGLRHDRTAFADTLVLVVYLLRARPVPLCERQTTEKELPGGETFFRGPHELPRVPLLKRFGADPQGFRQAGRALGGETLDFGDAAFRLNVLPRVPLDCILWAEDEEFPARLTCAFDASVAEQLPLDVIWALVHVTSRRLLAAGNKAATAGS